MYSLKKSINLWRKDKTNDERLRFVVLESLTVFTDMTKYLRYGKL